MTHLPSMQRGKSYFQMVRSYWSTLNYKQLIFKSCSNFFLYVVTHQSYQKFVNFLATSMLAHTISTQQQDYLSIFVGLSREYFVIPTTCMLFLVPAV